MTAASGSCAIETEEGRSDSSLILPYGRDRWLCHRRAVPAKEIRSLIAERPDAVGLSVPGMPYGTPGMGPETEGELYELLLMRKDGTSQVIATCPAASDWHRPQAGS